MAAPPRGAVDRRVRGAVEARRLWAPRAPEAADGDRDHGRDRQEGADRVEQLPVGPDRARAGRPGGRRRPGRDPGAGGSLDSRGPAWTAAPLPADWRAIRAHWELFHTIRTFLSIAAVVAVTVSGLWAPRAPEAPSLDRPADAAIDGTPRRSSHA